MFIEIYRLTLENVPKYLLALYNFQPSFNSPIFYTVIYFIKNSGKWDLRAPNLLSVLEDKANFRLAFYFVSK